ncbi:hypothetical protein DRO03_12040, partial [Methanosarcinales archaeon]
MFFSKPSNAGAGGAAMSGIVQGMIAGQNMRQSDERQDMLQQNFDNQQEDRESGDFMGRLYEMEQVNKNGGNVGEMLPGMNKFLENSTNFKGSSFVMDNFKNHQDEKGNYSQEFLNQYEADTGKSFVPGTSDAESYNNGRLMFNDEDGSRGFDFDTFSQGSAKYQQYRKDQAYSDILKEAKITKAAGTKGKVSEVKELAKLRNIENPTKVQKDEMEILETKLKTDVTGAVSDMFSDKNKQTLKTLSTGGEVDDGAVSDLMQAQITANQKFTKRPEKADKVTLATNLVRTNKELGSQFEEGGVNTGWAQNMKADMLKT